jgi:hypothetical protein
VVDALWIRALASRLAEHPEEVGVCGLVLPRSLDTAAQRRLEAYRGFGPRSPTPVSRRLERRRGILPLRMPMVVALDDAGQAVERRPLYRVGQYGIGANMAFRTADLRSAGGFDACLGAGTPARGGEDIELFVRLIWGGASLGYEPAAIVLHEHRRTETALRAQMHDYGIGLTAAITAMISADGRHAVAMLASLVEGVPRRVRTPRKGHEREAAHVPMRRREPLLKGLELVGMLRGTDAYLRSRWQACRGR